MSNEFIEEIQEDVRREELLKLWQKYGNWLIGAALIIIAGTSIGVYWDYHQHQKKIAQAEHYESALILSAEGNTQQALEILKKIAVDADKGYTLLSLFKQAGLEGNNVDVLRDVMNNPKIEPQFRDLANLIIIAHDLDLDNTGGVIQRLEPILSSNTPWRAMAAELLSVALIRLNRFDEAERVLKSLVQDESASNGVRMRATALLDYIRHH